MYKYIGDSILSASFTVQVPKPLDNRTVVNNLQELYSIPAAYAYLGMTVANIDNGNIYMLVDKSKIYEKSGWRASYESIQIISCTYAEYKEWLANTDENFQPIDDSKSYVHLDTYYYIYEDSLPGEEENQEYVRRSDWSELLNVVSGKASNDGLARTNQMVADIIQNYATKAFVTEGYAPLSMFDLENAESFISKNFFTKTEALEKFVKFSDLSGDDPGEGDFIFVTATRYETDQEALAQYQADLAEELTHFLRVGDDGELGNVVISQIKSPVVDDQQLVVNVTPEGFKVGNDRFAMLSDVPPHVTLTKAEYDELVANDLIDENVYYHITGDDETYVLQSELESSYYTKTGVQSYIAGKTYTKQEVDDIISALSFYTQEQADNKYVTKTSLETTLEDYVTIAMLGGDDMEGQFIFVKASDYQEDQEALATQREQDLQQIENDYIKKDSDASLNSLETATIKSGLNTLSLSEVLKLNNKKLALDEDVPVIRVVSATEYEELTKDPDVYYFVYNTNENLAFVTAEELENYYTKSQTNSKILEYINENQGSIPTQLSELTEDTTHRVVTDAEKTAWNAKSDFSGSYNDLSDKPTIPSLTGYATETWVSNLINDILGIDASNVEALVDILSDEDTMTGLLSVIAGKADKTELFSGSYNDLTDKPSIPTAQDKANWDGAVTALGGLSLVKLTQAEYDALVDKDANTLYIVT